MYEQERDAAYLTDKAASNLYKSALIYVAGEVIGKCTAATNIGLILALTEMGLEFVIEKGRAKWANTLKEMYDLQSGMIVLECHAYMSRTVVYIPWNGSSNRYGIDWGTYPFAYNKGGHK